MDPPCGLTTMKGSKRVAMLLIHLLAAVSALSSRFSKVELNPTTFTTSCSQRRRSVVLSGLCGCLTATLSLSPLPSAFDSLRDPSLAFLPRSAWAVQERNEALCGTGFFTNFMEYRCTEIGDISDEGLPGGLSDSQSQRADALLSKFQLDSASASDGGATSVTDEARTTERGPTGTAQRPQQQ